METKLFFTFVLFTFGPLSKKQFKASLSICESLTTSKIKQHTCCEPLCRQGSEYKNSISLKSFIMKMMFKVRKNTSLSTKLGKLPELEGSFLSPKNSSTTLSWESLISQPSMENVDFNTSGSLPPKMNPLELKLSNPNKSQGTVDFHEWLQPSSSWKLGNVLKPTCFSTLQAIFAKTHALFITLKTGQSINATYANSVVQDALIQRSAYNVTL